MTDLSSYLENAVQTWWADGSAFPSPPASTFVALHTADPTNDGSAGEVTATDYSRAEAAQTVWDVTGSGPTNVTNNAEVQFATATSSWGTVSHISVWDAETGGNCLWQGDLASSKLIEADDRFILEVGDFDADLN